MAEKLHIIPHDHPIQMEDRNQQNQHSSFVVWLTGLSGSGKSTLASLLEQELHKLGVRTYILDGDNVRKGLNSDLDFSETSRVENIRRIGEVANLFVQAGVVTITAFISPFRSDRQRVREILDDRYVEVFVDCPLEVCEQRDVKGLYKKARAGEITNFTGIDSPFEQPENPDIHVQTHVESTQESLDKMMGFIKKRLKLEESHS